MAQRKGLTASTPIERRILIIRGHKVMLDADLAELHAVPTKRLNEQCIDRRDHRHSKSHQAKHGRRLVVSQSLLVLRGNFKRIHVSCYRRDEFFRAPHLDLPLA